MSESTEKKLRIGIVTPTIRELSFLDNWPDLRAWDIAPDITAYIVVDKLWDGTDGSHIEALSDKGYNLPDDLAYDHYMIAKYLGEDGWIIPRKTDCIRSLGYYLAYADGMDMIFTVDDDCIWDEFTLQGHIANLFASGVAPEWFGAVRHQRGIPYNYRHSHPIIKTPGGISVGEWTGVPDYDAPTQLVLGGLPKEIRELDDPGLKRLNEQGIMSPGIIAAEGNYPACCGMNLAFIRELVPAMYFLLMGKDYPYDRFGDIWCGMFAKKVCDHLKRPVITGGAPVHHTRASNTWRNLEKERAALEAHEGLWQEIHKMVINGDDAKSCYIDIANKLDSAYLDPEYLASLKRAMLVWAGLF